MSDATWNFTADEQDLWGLKPSDRLGPGVVGEPVEREAVTVTLHRTELIPGENGARIGYSDDFPNHQFLILPNGSES